MAKKTPKKIGTYIDRNYKLIKSMFLKAFNELNQPITIDQWIIMDILNEKGTLAQHQLAELSFKDVSTVSRIINLMVEKDLITKRKSDDDKRRYDIALTQSASDIISAVQDDINVIRKQLLKGIKVQEYKELIRMLDKIYENAHDVSTSVEKSLKKR